MALSPGSQLGQFEILRPIGAGGMGEVYRARDTRLGREVAIKVLPESVASDPDRIARFEREARSLAALHHPNIATLFGMERAAAADGQATAHFLVMECVEGSELGERIAAGHSGRAGLPVAVALALARQIAEALEAAHERGIIHRDLKPANIKVTADDVVKVLDFGLAKALDTTPAGAANVSQSPTLSAMATEAGIILGTAAYMSPEQAKGQPTDHRSDVFAFGSVLFETVTGHQAFGGESVADIMASVLAREPEWSRLPPDLDPRVTALLRRCLAKSRRQRWQAIGDVRVELESIASGPAHTAAPLPVPPAAVPPLWRRAMPAAGGALIGALGVGAAFLAMGRATPPTGDVRPVELSIVLPDDQRISTGTSRLAVAPDGSQVVFAANGRLYRRPLSSRTAEPILGTELPDTTDPVFSPDGTAVAFVSGRRVLRVPVAGGAPTVVSEVEVQGSALSRLAWDRGFIWVTQVGTVQRLPENGGKAEVVVTLEPGESAASPQPLPDGDALLMTVARGAPRPDWANAQVVVQSLSTGRRTVVIPTGTDGRYLSSGHLVYAVAGVIYAVRFDLATLRVMGAPVPALQGVRRASAGGLMRPEAHLAVSAAGLLAYLPGPALLSASSTVALIEPGGKETTLPLPPGMYDSPRVSPDGKRLAVGSDDGQDAAIWVYDLTAASAIRRFTFAGKNHYPVWSPDGRRLAFQSDRDGAPAIYVQTVDGADKAERLMTRGGEGVPVPESWSPHGELSFSMLSGSSSTLWLYSFADKSARAVEGVERLGGPVNSQFSPDGRWIAYTSRSTPFGVFLQPVPITGAKYQVSNRPSETGHHPFWSADGKTLYYLGWEGGAYLTEVPIAGGTTPTIGEARRVPGDLQTNTTNLGSLNYGSLPDRRFVGVRFGAGFSVQEFSEVRIVLNWSDELKRLVR